ncbi:MAG: flagellar basal body rod protein FlgB [Fibrobacteres bacterium]|nr:flagellar basal body rod protein FlgB [Fibrobacterota bacterium]
MEKINEHIFRGTKRYMVNKSLDAGMLRSKAIAQNIANVDVEGYQRKEVKFEEELRKAMKIKTEGAVTHDKHIEISKEAKIKRVKPELVQPYDPSNPSGQNNVDIDIENAKMAENQILYNYGIKFAGFTKLKAAIQGKM